MGLILERLNDSVVTGRLTHLRPRGFTTLFASLQSQTLHRNPAATVQFLVADHDPLGNAHSMVETFARQAKFPLVYLHEPQPGMACAKIRPWDTRQNWQNVGPTSINSRSISVRP